MYCSNCGNDIKVKNVCRECGYKLAKGKNYCSYCGELMEEGAYVCTRCGKKRYRKKIIPLIFSYITAVILLGLLFFLDFKFSIPITTLLLVNTIWIVCTLPFVWGWSKRLNSKIAKICIGFSRKLIIIVLFLFVVGECSMITAFPIQASKTVAVDEAFSILKNPESLQIHSAEYYIYNYSETEPHLSEYTMGAEEFYIVWEIEYSAQNGFGGLNRETVQVSIIATSVEGLYEYDVVDCEYSE